MGNRGFRDIIQTTAVPPWLRGGPESGFIGSKLLYTILLGADLLVEKLEEGVHARMPGFQEDPSALPLQGADRLIDRGLSETDASYARRLQKALDSWAHAGSALAQMQQLLAYIAPASLGIRLVHDTTDASSNPVSTWYSIEAGGTSDSLPRVDYRTDGNWDWDGVYGAEWWRTWIVIYVPASLWQPEQTWGNGTWGDGGVWGLTATPGEIAALRLLVQRWKSKHSWCRWIILAFDTTTFQPYHASGGGVNPDGTYGRWSIYTAGLQQETRIDSARYVDGTPYQVVRGGSGNIIDTIGA